MSIQRPQGLFGSTTPLASTSLTVSIARVTSSPSTPPPAPLTSPTPLISPSFERKARTRRSKTRQLGTHQASPRQDESHLAAFRAQDETYRAPKVIISEPTNAMPQSTTGAMLATSTFTAASCIILHARQTLGEMVSVVCADGEEVLPFMHIVLVYLHGSAFVPGTVSHVGRCMPWDKISRFVNALRQYVVVESQSIAMEFPQQQTVAGRQLPEDFGLRGSTLAQNYFPLKFFDDLNPSTKERMEERPEYVVYRG
jgi:hypothetical protein